MIINVFHKYSEICLNKNLHLTTLIKVNHHNLLKFNRIEAETAQSAFTCSKSSTKTPEKCMESVQS